MTSKNEFIEFNKKGVLHHFKCAMTTVTFTHLRPQSGHFN